MRRLPCGRGERMKPELKDLLKPPFFRDDENKFVNEHFAISVKWFIDLYKVIKRKEVPKLRDNVIFFLMDAITEKWQREFGESKRCYVRCPKCNVGMVWKDNKCPSCGAVILPPEGKEEEEKVCGMTMKEISEVADELCEEDRKYGGCDADVGE